MVIKLLIPVALAENACIAPKYEASIWTNYSSFFPFSPARFILLYTVHQFKKRQSLGTKLV